MTTYVLENQRHRVSAKILPYEADGRWHYRLELRTARDQMFGPASARGFVHLPVAINEALQELDEMSATLPDTERQVLMLWSKQANRAAWAGISDEKRDEMYQDERKARSGRR